MILKFVLLLVLFCACGQASFGRTQNTADSLLNQLDEAISVREEYTARKEARIKELHDNMQTAADYREEFGILGQLFNEYLSYNADSAYAVAQRQLALARQTVDRNLIMNAMLNEANILSAVGMYPETMAIIDSIPYDALPDYLRAYYFHTKRTLYGDLANFAAFEPERKHYKRLTDEYRDSLLNANDPSSVFYAIIKADRLNVHGKPREAIDLLEGFMRRNDLPEHDLAICAFTLSDSYRIVGDTQNQKIQLLIAAISDMKTAVREYIALRQLALLLYKEGDLERAYEFLSIAVDDASKSNARKRIVELNESYPMINGIYVETVRKQKKSLERTIVIIAVLSVILITLLFYMRKQMIKISESRKVVEEANARLVKTNNKLQEAYGEIAEISELKEVYICQYMDQSLEYIELLDTYRKSVGRLVGKGKTEELKDLVKSTKIIDDELKAFYAQFDKTFLNLFPTFVDDFNQLLLPEEAIVSKKEGSLNTELRIFALIRLGITDSNQIAKFLRYSLTTIYNYRTKVRNKAKGDRNLLEQEVAKIGKHA